MSKWIRKGDQVVVTAGNERGKTGKVIGRQGDRVIVEGINMRKKHMKPKAQGAPRIVEMEGSLHISNISIAGAEGKPVKVKVKTDKKGDKQLVYLNKGKEVVHRAVKKHAG